MEEKCCNNGCLIVGLLSAEDELRPIVHDAKRLKAEASKRGNQTSVPLRNHHRVEKKHGETLRSQPEPGAGWTLRRKRRIVHSNAQASQRKRVRAFHSFVTDELPLLYHAAAADVGHANR